MYDVIFAKDTDNGIGLAGALPWDCPEDLTFFKRITLGTPLVCAYKTYIGLPKVVQKRVAIVQSSRFLDLGPDIRVIGNINAELLNSLTYNTIVIGGSSLFTVDIFKGAKTVYESTIYGTYTADTFISQQALNSIRFLPYEILINSEKLSIRKYYGQLPKTTAETTTERLEQ